MPNSRWAAPGTRPALLGPWIKLPSPMSVEAMFAAGADFVCIDMCNGWLSIDRVADLLAHAAQPGPRLVRLAAGSPTSTAGQVLDAGADGIVLPHVNSVDDARHAVAAALFPPDGTRGMGSTGRAGRWGLVTTGDYLATGRLDGAPPFISVMIETAESVRQAAELAKIDGVSQLLIGTADLGLDLGHDTALLDDAADEVLRACLPARVSAGIAVGRPEDALRYVRRGFDMVYISNDLTLLARSAQACFAAARTEPGA